MKFLYKIYSRYDGFIPRRIPERLLPRRVLPLGWTRYLDAVEPGSEVWVFFHGPHAFEPGVYVKGFVQRVDAAGERVFLRVREYSGDRPLTDPATSARVARVVAPRFRQVFVLPEELEPSPRCDLHGQAESCRARQCGSCRVWGQLPVVRPKELLRPNRLPAELRVFAPGYWVIPSRCYLIQERRAVAAPVRTTSELFYRFKVGEDALAYPLALAMYEALKRACALDLDCIVPIPLSPDKAASRELHRTRALARELSRLLDAPVAELLTLTRPISKGRLRNEGIVGRQFEIQYADALATGPELFNYASVLLVDDVCTHGSTLRCAFNALRSVAPGLEVKAAVAGQMVLKESVASEGTIAA